MADARIARADIDWTTIVPDYTPEYVAAMRRLSGERKLIVAGANWCMARKIKAAGLRHLHPTWSAQQIDEGVKRAMLSTTSG